MPRTDVFLKVVLDHDDSDDPRKLAEEISRRLEKFYGVRSVELSNVVTEGREPAW